MQQKKQKEINKYPCMEHACACNSRVEARVLKRNNIKKEIPGPIKLLG